MEKEKIRLASVNDNQTDRHNFNTRPLRVARSDYSRFRIPGTSIEKFENKALETEKNLVKIEQKIVHEAEVLEEKIEEKVTEAKSEAVSIISKIELPGEESVKKYGVVVKRSLREIISSIAFKIATTAIIISIGFGSYVFAISYTNLNKVLKGGAKSSAALLNNVDPSLLSGEGSGRVNVLLMGRGGGNHDGPDLTDTMMIASLDPVDKNITLISIPRDLWVEVPNHGSMKINAVWETGEFAALGRVQPGSTDPQVLQAGYNLVDQTINDVTGIKIDYNVLADFQAFRQAVDAIGGVTVNVPTTLIDPTMAWENYGNPVLAKAGIQNFNGVKALNYVRSRETTTDFARAERQRAVLIAIKQKVETVGIISNPIKLTNLLNSFGDNVATDMTLSDAEKMYENIKDINPENIKSIGLTDPSSDYIKTAAVGNQSVDVPIAGMFNYTDIRNFIRGALPDPYIVKENAKILVLNGTNDAGLLAKTIAELKSYGYDVVGSGNTNQKNYAATSIVQIGNVLKPYTRHFLINRMNATLLKDMPENLNIATSNPNFVIILGNNATVNN